MSARRPHRSSVRSLLDRIFGPVRAVRSRHTTSLVVLALEARETPAAGLSIGVGDVDGDAYPDIVASRASEGAPLVRVLDGKTGQILREFFAYDDNFLGGVNVAVGDIDGDGVNEIITGTGNGGAPHVRVFDGKSGNERFGFFPYESTFRGGVIVAAADVTGDGRAEIITGTGVGGGPRVQVIDAATRTAISDYFAYEDSFRGGVLVGAGDVNGDGRADVVTGTGVGGAPRVQVFDGVTQAVVSNFFAYENTFRGGVVVSTGDLDGDGKDEVLTGTGPGGGPAITAFEGGSNQSVVRFLAFDAQYRGGIAVAGADLNGDGMAEFVGAASPNETPTIVIFTPDGSTILFTFSPFEPGGLPNRGFSTKVVPPFTNPTTILPPVGLQVSTDQVGAGLNERLTFTARVPSVAPVTRVQLFQGDDLGRPVVPLVDLYDDGDFTHRDAVAGDGMFSNALSVNLPTAGQHVFVAVVSTTSGTARYSVRVTAVQIPTETRVAARVEMMTYQQSRLFQLVEADVPLPEALDIIRTQLEIDPSVRTTSLQTGSVSLTWESVEGIRLGIIATLDRGDIMTSAPLQNDKSQGTSVTTPGAGPCPDSCGSALILSPFQAEFSPFDPGAMVAEQFRAKGYSVTFETDSQVTIDDFENWGRYDAVVVSTHGEEADDPNAVPMVMTGERVRIDRAMERLADLLAGRVTMMSDYFAVTPSFFETYSGSMDGSVVYIGACRSARTNALANTFVRDLGAAAYAGFSDYVYTDFAYERATKMFTHLLNGGTVGTIPGAGLTETRDLPEPLRSSTNNGHATFRVFERDRDAKLDPRCDLLENYDLQITYTWTHQQYDLDTGTEFLGDTVGDGYDGAEYMTFSGDDTEAGGREVVTIDLYDALTADAWDETVEVALRAGWSTFAGGFGPATVTIALRHKTTGQLRNAVQVPITPGSQTGPATELVGIVTVSEVGDDGHHDVIFSVATTADSMGLPTHETVGED